MQDITTKINSDDDGDDTVDTPTREKRETHPLCKKLRDLRNASGLSLSQIERDHGVRAVVVGAYERGDREPPLKKLDILLSVYGYRLVIEPIAGIPVVRTHADIAEQLTAFARQLAAE